MPIRKPIKTIKKKLGLKKTFEKKRKALGVIKYNNGKGPLIAKLSVNPKISKIETSSLKKRIILNNKLIKLGEFKPKSELEVRKKKNAIALVKEKIKEEKNSAELKIKKVNAYRNKQRDKRQEQIIFNKLYSLLSKREQRILKQKLAILKISTYSFADKVLLREKYLELLKIKKKTFADVSSRESLYLLMDSIKEK